MRSPSRRNHWPHIQAPGHWFGMGPQAEDAITGVRYPKRLMTEQRGGLVSARPQDDNVDRCEGREWPVEAQPTMPSALYRLSLPFGGAFASLVTASAVERDNNVQAGWLWTPAGYGYSDASAEAGLVPVYRLLNGADHLLTANAAERTSTLGMRYTDEGVGFYAFTTSAHNRTPLYRVTVAGPLHFYTADVAEYHALPASYTREGAICYVLVGPERTYS